MSSMPLNMNSLYTVKQLSKVPAGTLELKNLSGIGGDHKVPSTYILLPHISTMLG